MSKASLDGLPCSELSRLSKKIIKKIQPVRQNLSILGPQSEHLSKSAKVPD